MDDAVTPKALPSYRTCFFCGREGFLRLFYDGNEVYADFVAEKRFEGFHGIMHGGLVTGILDEVMWWRLFVGEGVVGVTWRLDVEFRKPIVSGNRYRAVSREVAFKRKVYAVKGFIEDEQGVPCASSKGLYVKRRDIGREDMLKAMDLSH